MEVVVEVEVVLEVEVVVVVILTFVVGSEPVVVLKCSGC